MVDANEQRCKDVTYNRRAAPAGAAVHMAVHVSGRQYTVHRGAVVAKNYFHDR